VKGERSAPYQPKAKKKNAGQGKGREIYFETLFIRQAEKKSLFGKITKE
jgi:hypothetical protein